MQVEIEKKPILKTYEEICLDKLREIGRSTLMGWAKAMGYRNQNSMSKIVKRLKNDIIITRHKSRRLHFYEAKDNE